MKRISSQEIALSAISCAFATIMMTVGTLYTPLLFTGYLFACAALMLPLAKKYYVGCGLAYIASFTLTMIFNGFNFFDTMPYIVFFGLHPLVNGLQKKYGWNRYVSAAVKAAWFDAAMYAVWRFTFGMNTAIPFIDKYILPIILIAGTAFFLVYDYAMFRCQKQVDFTVDRFLPKR